MKKIVLSILFLATATVYSQDIRGVDMVVNNVTGKTFQANLILYTDSALTVNRPFVIIDWGVNLDTLFLSAETYLTGGFSKKEYNGATFTYPSDGYYNISYIDSFRIAGIANILNSQTQSIKIVHENILSPFLGYNNSPKVSPQNEIAINNNKYSYSINAIDPDGDSLFFKLVPCYSSNYIFPDSIDLDSLNGIINFYPQYIGIYTVAYKIEEWRMFNGQYYFIGTSTHDLSIIVNSLTGISESNKDNQILNIYPNPANNQITVKFETIEKEILIEIKNLLGQTVYSELLKPSTENYSKTIDISILSNGVYFLQVQSNASVFSKKFVKQ